jgi:hypothetical protein
VEEDRRDDQRFVADWPVTMVTSRGDLQARVKNMSASGAFIRSDQTFPPGERFRLAYLLQFLGVNPREPAWL